MDIVAHALWAGVGVALARRQIPVDRRTAGLTVALAVLPDVVQLLPLLAWILSTNGALETLSAYSLASPGTEPALPPLVEQRPQRDRGSGGDGRLLVLVAPLLAADRRLVAAYRHRRVHALGGFLPVAGAVPADDVGLRWRGVECALVGR